MSMASYMRGELEIDPKRKRHGMTNEEREEPLKYYRTRDRVDDLMREQGFKGLRSGEDVEKE